ncbi:hypothetical protein ABT174_01060 [Streptomyces sparsogenes]|uniref:hypothetical protein n=1 Tax=Streptomyces sparsogenes TaxID=67365 RepID=UPI00331DF84D
MKDGEVPQAYDVPVQDPSPEERQKTLPPVSDASCQRVLNILEAEDASAVVVQIYNWKENIFGGDSTLASYEGTKAQKAFGRLQDSLADCRSFSGVSVAGKYKAKVTMDKAPDVGDEALSFHVVIPLPDGEGRRDEHHVFVRADDVTASFTDTNVGMPARFPLGLVNKQVERLNSAQRP